MASEIGLECDDDAVVRELLAPLERVQPVSLTGRPGLRPLANGDSRRFGRRRVVLIAAVGAVIAAVGSGVAAATGVLQWDTTRALRSVTFGTGGIVRLSVAGPESTVFEVATKTVRFDTVRVHCTAVIAKAAQGRPRHLTAGCGARGAAVPKAAIIDWQAPSGVTYAIITGPAPTPTAVKVALLAGNGLTAATEPVAGGYYLVYAPAELPASKLVFYDAHGHVVRRLALQPSQ